MNSISRKQFIALFVCALLIWITLQSFTVMLPVYALRLGADPSSIGNFLAVGFLGLTTGNFIAGWLSDRFQRRKLLLTIAITINVFGVLSLGSASTFTQFVILTSMVYIFSSVSMSLITILAGLSASESERGKVFGGLAVATSLGAVIAGAISGWLVNRGGFEAFFFVLAMGWVIDLLVLLVVEDRNVAPVKRQAETSAPPTLNRWFYIMLTANLIGFACSFMSLLGRPLQMDALRFDPEAISGVVAIGSIISVPLPFVMGWLSDRFSRYYLVIFCILSSAVGLIVLAGSSVVWQFALATALLSNMAASIGVGQAIITDLVPPKSLGVALSLFGSSITIGGAISFAGTGYAIEAFGIAGTYIVGAVLSLIATGMLLQGKLARDKGSIATLGVE